MPSLASPLKLRFLLDENVNRRLGGFLSAQGHHVAFASQGITNDSDFSDSLRYSRENIFSIIWLLIPQQKPDVLLTAFDKLLKEKQKAGDFEGNLIKLVEHTYEIRPLFDARDLK